MGKWGLLYFFCIVIIAKLQNEAETLRWGNIHPMLGVATLEKNVPQAQRQKRDGERGKGENATATAETAGDASHLRQCPVPRIFEDKEKEDWETHRSPLRARK